MGAGVHALKLDARDGLSSGVYLVQLSQAGKTQTARALLIH